MKTMNAIITTRYGSHKVLQLKKVNKPIPKENEILVKIKAASITTAETMMRTGKPYIGRLFTGISKPKNSIPGTGFAGIIESVGSKVKLFIEGDEVFGENIATFGTNAEFVCVREDGVVALKPSNMTFEEAAPVCDGALASMNFLTKIANVKPEQKVLIIGASGSLGTAAVQLAKYIGAAVTGVCGPTNIGMVKSLGADYVIDYSMVDFISDNKIYDIIFDTVGKSSFKKCKKILSKNGQYLSPVLGLSLMSDMICTSLFGKKKAKFSATGMLPPKELRALLHELKLMIEDKQLRTVMDRTYSLDQTYKAHEYVDLGHKKGNVVVIND